MAVIFLELVLPHGGVKHSDTIIHTSMGITIYLAPGNVCPLKKIGKVDVAIISVTISLRAWVHLSQRRN